MTTERETIDVTADPAAANVGAPSSPAPLLMRPSVYGDVIATRNRGHVRVTDVNLLDADTANLVQTKGTWTVGGGGYATPTLVAATGAFGGQALRTLVTGGGLIAHSAVTVSPSATHTVIVRARVDLDCDLELSLQRFNASDVYEGRTAAPAVPMTAGQWEWLVLVASSGTTGKVRIVVDENDSITGDTNIDIDVAMLAAGTHADWSPSLHLRSSLDARVRLIPSVYGVDGGIIGRWNSSHATRAWMLNRRGGVGLLAIDATNQTPVSVYGSAFAVTDRGQEPTWWRGVYVPNDDGVNRRHEVFESLDGAVWDSLGSSVTAAASPINYAAQQMRVGSMVNAGDPGFAGAILYAELRDGEDGPVVLSVSPADVEAGVSLQGHPLTLVDESSGAADLIDRDCWHFTGSEHIAFVDRDDLDVGAEFEMAIRSIWRPTGTNVYDTGKQGTGPGKGAAFQFRADDKWLAQVGDDSQNRTASGLHSVDDGAWGTFGAALEDGTLTTYVEDTSVGSIAVDTADRTNANPKTLGATSPTITALHKTPIQWIAWFEGPLTPPQRTELTAWGGSIDDEPSWLRGAAALYVNAADPETQAAYPDAVVDPRLVPPREAITVPA